MSSDTLDTEPTTPVVVNPVGGFGSRLTVIQGQAWKLASMQPRRTSFPPPLPLLSNGLGDHPRVSNMYSTTIPVSGEVAIHHLAQGHFPAKIYPSGINSRISVPIFGDTTLRSRGKPCVT